MIGASQWMDGRGRIRWQPTRNDLAMVWVCAAGYCIRSWAPQSSDDYWPVVFRFRWVAVTVPVVAERRAQKQDASRLVRSP